jgi:hypothetical protein
LTPRRAAWLAALSGLGLLLCTSVTWYHGLGGSSLTAWEAFDGTDVVLAFAGCTALLFGVAIVARPGAAFAVPGSSVIAGAGSVGAALVLIRILDPPDGLSVRAGAWQALAACLAIAVAGYYGMQEEGLPSASNG